MTGTKRTFGSALDRLSAGQIGGRIPRQQIEEQHAQPDVDPLVAEIDDNSAVSSRSSRDSDTATQRGNKAMRQQRDAIMPGDDDAATEQFDSATALLQHDPIAPQHHGAVEKNKGSALASQRDSALASQRDSALASQRDSALASQRDSALASQRDSATQAVGKTKSAHTSIYLDPDLLKWLKRYAIDNDTSVNRIFVEHAERLRNRNS